MRAWFEYWYGDGCPSWAWPLSFFVFFLVGYTLTH